MDIEEIDVNTRNWTDSVQDRDYWRALVNAAVNLWVPYALGLVFIGFVSHLSLFTLFTMILFSTVTSSFFQIIHYY
jgi:hypothetical protein